MNSAALEKKILKDKIGLMLRNKQLDESILEKLSIRELVEEISIYHQELVYQNEELMRSGAEVEEKKNRYQELFDEAPIGYLVMDDDFNIISANRVFCQQLIKTDLQDVHGQSLTRFIAPHSQDAFYLGMKELQRNGRLDAVELSLRCGAEIVTVQFSGNRTEQGDETLIRGALIDISSRKQAEETLRASEQKLLALKLADQLPGAH